MPVGAGRLLKTRLNVMSQIRILICDDHPMVRQGVETMLSVFDDLKLVQSASNIQEGMRFVSEHRPDIMLLDWYLGDTEGISNLKLLKSLDEQLKIIILTSFNQHDIVSLAMEKGASGFHFKDISAEQLVNAIRTVHKGEMSLAPQAARVLVESVIRKKEPSLIPTDLSQRELQVLGLIVKGLTNAEISQKLDIKQSTVKTYVSRILGKLNVASRVEATALALKHGLV